MSKKRILVVDDDKAVLEMLCQNLQDCGYDVFSACDGELALQMIAAGNVPDLVVTDIMMPKKEGLEVIVEIRQKFPAVKLVAISGGGRAQDGDFLAMADRYGADLTLRKPINMPELEKKIEKILVK
jgi:CheY-like chemotaxis protein